MHGACSKRLKEKNRTPAYYRSVLSTLSVAIRAQTRVYIREQRNYVIFYDDEILPINIALCRLAYNRIYSHHNLHIIFRSFELPLSLGFNATTSSGNRRHHRRRRATLYHILTHTHTHIYTRDRIIYYLQSTCGGFIDGQADHTRKKNFVCFNQIFRMELNNPYQQQESYWNSV